MTFSAYIQRQKTLIRERHEGELFLIEGNNAIKLRSSDEILQEMENLKGLNKNERSGYERITIRRR
jgi:hypothetical protein